MRRAVPWVILFAALHGAVALGGEVAPTPPAPAASPAAPAIAPVAEPVPASALLAPPLAVKPAGRPEPIEIELPKAEPPELDTDLGFGWILLRTLIVLGIVIIAIYLSLNFGLRRLMGIQSVPRSQAVVQVVERIPLDQKRSMFVIKAAGEYLLIGGGDGSLQLISKLDSAEVERLQSQRPASLQLSPFLQKLLKRPAVPPASSGDNS